MVNTRRSDVVVREALADDWGQIWPIWRRVVATGETYTWDIDQMTETDARAAWMLPPPAVVLVAVADGGNGAIVGSADLRPNQPGHGDHVANASFIVDPSIQQRGVGTALASAVLDRARRDGYRAMQFNAVVETNDRARALWERFGFSVVGRVPGAFRHASAGDVDLLVMHRWL